MFSNSAVIVSCNLRVGSKVHPCTVEPKMRIHAHFTLVCVTHYKKTLHPSANACKTIPVSSRLDTSYLFGLCWIAARAGESFV